MVEPCQEQLAKASWFFSINEWPVQRFSLFSAEICLLQLPGSSCTQAPSVTQAISFPLSLWPPVPMCTVHLPFLGCPVLGPLHLPDPPIESTFSKAGSGNEYTLEMVGAAQAGERWDFHLTWQAALQTWAEGAWPATQG